MDGFFRIMLASGLGAGLKDVFKGGISWTYNKFTGGKGNDSELEINGVKIQLTKEQAELFTSIFSSFQEGKKKEKAA